MYLSTRKIEKRERAIEVTEVIEVKKLCFETRIAFQSNQ